MSELSWQFGRAALLALGGLSALGAVAIWLMTAMPGRSYQGPPATSPAHARLADSLRAHVVALAATLGERNLERHAELERAASYVAAALAPLGCAVERQRFEARGRSASNVECELPGTTHAEEIVVVGAHYDSVRGSPGANDNASGVAVLLELAQRAAAVPRERTLRFLAFANEEPPHFQTREMGSLVYAERSLARAERVVAMLSLESLGFYSDVRGSQRYPAGFGLLYPSRGNFVAFVTNPQSRGLARRAIAAFRGSHAAVATEGVAAPAFIPGVAWSDHWAFWAHGVPAIMVTDTAVFRDPHYHTLRDTPERLDYARMASVVDGLEAVITALVGKPLP
jgi:hypothetical protein